MQIIGASSFLETSFFKKIQFYALGVDLLLRWYNSKNSQRFRFSKIHFLIKSNTILKFMIPKKISKK